jgi:glycerol-3-phosphate dehydrogenase subunit C
MATSDSWDCKTPQEIIRGVLELCADCDTCRTLMVEDCLFFPELYRIWDKEKATGVPISEAEMRSLVELCTLCALCPCPKIPVEVMEAKSLYIDREGLPMATRLLNDVPRLAKLCGSFPRIVNALQSNKAIRSLMQKIVHIHPDRCLPQFPEQSFFRWAENKGLDAKREGGRNVAYFAGCTAGYLFPQIGRAVVDVLERNGVTVHVPQQHCCGMPLLVEGDRSATLQLVRSNMESLLAAVQAGDDLVCSCPTCGFFMKFLLKERAYYSEAYQRSVNAGEDEIKIPDPRHGKKKHGHLIKSIYRRSMKDDGYFSTIDPMARIELSDHLYDVGEYLARLRAEGLLDTGFKAIPEQMVYFAPCHQREQNMGRPYLDLLRLIPGITIELLGEADCCGMGGNFGFKDDFHEKSLVVGQPLLEKIRKQNPRAIITDCMSCSLQFHQVLPYPVFHPIEILARAYGAGDTKATAMNGPIGE